MSYFRNFPLVDYNFGNEITPALFQNLTTRISLNKGLRIGDIISLHMPLNKFTHKFVDNKFLSMIKNDAILINTSRAIS